MQNGIVIVALESELDIALWNFEVPVVFTGVGKINAALRTHQAIEKYRPDLIVNVGTVGSLKIELGKVCEIGSVVQRDFDTTPLAPRGIVPFDGNPSIYYSADGKFRCGTGDSFVTKLDPWLIENKIDVVDMELFAIAQVCAEKDIPWKSFKFVSDMVGSNSKDEWVEGKSEASARLIEVLSNYFLKLSVT